VILIGPLAALLAILAAILLLLLLFATLFLVALLLLIGVLVGHFLSPFRHTIMRVTSCQPGVPAECCAPSPRFRRGVAAARPSHFIAATLRPVIGSFND